MNEWRDNPEYRKRAKRAILAAIVVAILVWVIFF